MLGKSQRKAQDARDQRCAVKNRVDEFIKAFYFDKPEDLFQWMKKTKDEFEARHFMSIFETGLVGQSTSSTSYLSGGAGGSSRVVGGGRKEIKQEFDRLVTSFYG